jgi:DNA end-binding protein Ku
MAQRPIWRGHLRLALVSCPVALYSARHERNSIRFNMINPKTGNRIKMVTQDAETGEPLSRGETVKGYEFSKGRYVIITDEDLESVKIESSGMMTIEKFVTAESVDPIYYDASYYLAPDGKAGDDVYAVLMEAIEKTGRVAISRVVIAQRERTIALRQMGGGLIAHTLNEQRDLNEAGPLFEHIARGKSDPEMVQLAVQLIDRQTSAYEPADLEDRYETRLRAMLDAKIQGQEVHEEAPAILESNVVDLMAALRKSLGQPPEPAQTQPSAAKKPGKRAQSTEDVRRQPALKLPLQGGKKPSAGAPAATSEAAGRGGRRKAS